MTFSHQIEINQPFKLTIYVSVIRTCKTASFFLGFYAFGYTKQDMFSCFVVHFFIGQLMLLECFAFT